MFKKSAMDQELKKLGDFQFSNTLLSITEITDVSASEIYKNAMPGCTVWDESLFKVRDKELEEELYAKLNDLLKNTKNAKKEEFINKILELSSKAPFKKESEVLIVAASYDLKISNTLITEIINLLQ